MTNIEPLLAQTSFLKGLSSENRRAISAICIRKELRKKEFLFHEQHHGNAMFLLARGAVQLHKTIPEGKEVVIKVIKPGEIFAEVILFEKDHYPVTATALESSTLYSIPKREFQNLLAKEDFRNDFIRVLLAKQRYLANQILSITSRDVEERFFRFLFEHFGPHETITQSLSKKDIAAAIGTTPETLSRTLVKLKKEGILNWENKTIRIRNGFWNKWKNKTRS